MSAPIPTQAPREDYDDFLQRYVEAFSFGSPEDRALRKSVSDETAQRVLERSRQIEDDFPCCGPDKEALARIKHAIMARITQDTALTSHETVRMTAEFWVETEEAR